MNNQIFLLPFNSFEWTSMDGYLLQFISNNRQNKLHKFYFPSDKRHCLYSALLTRMEISLLLNQPLSNLSFDLDNHRKPYLKNDKNVHFNISHTKGAILLGLSSESIGVDIELNNNPPFDIMPSCFHEDEVLYVNAGLSEKERSIHLFNVWTRKEAYTKYTGRGLYDNLKKINTQSIIYQPDFVTWTHEAFICSLYSKTPTKKDPTIITETDIVNFYCNQ